MKITKARLRQMIKEEMDAMAFADMDDEGAGIEDIPQPEGEEPIDVLMDVKARLAGMSDEELMQLAADLDGDMVTALRHILSNRMYAPTGELVREGILDPSPPARGELPMGAFGSPEGEEDLEIAQEWREDAVKEIVRVLADLGQETSADEVEQALSQMGDVTQYIRRAMRAVSSEMNKRGSSRHPLLRAPRRNHRSGELAAAGELYYRPVDYMYRLLAAELGLVDESTAGLV